MAAGSNYVDRLHYLCLLRLVRLLVLLGLLNGSERIVERRYSLYDRLRERAGMMKNCSSVVQARFENRSVSEPFFLPRPPLLVSGYLIALTIARCPLLTFRRSSMSSM